MNLKEKLVKAGMKVSSSVRVSKSGDARILEIEIELEKGATYEKLVKEFEYTSNRLKHAPGLIQDDVVELLSVKKDENTLIARYKVTEAS